MQGTYPRVVQAALRPEQTSKRTRRELPTAGLPPAHRAWDCSAATPERATRADRERAGARHLPQSRDGPSERGDGAAALPRTRERVAVGRLRRR